MDGESNRSGGRGAIVKNSHQNLINWVSCKNSPQIICNRYPQKIGRKLSFCVKKLVEGMGQGIGKLEQQVAELVAVLEQQVRKS